MQSSCLNGLSGFHMIPFCLIQATQLGWTLAQLQQIFPVRNVSYMFIVSYLFNIILLIFFLMFLQDVPAQEQNDNLFPTTPPLPRTAAPMLASEAPRAHRPAAWHD